MDPSRKYYPLICCVAIAALFTAYVVSWSIHYGKLSVPPDYDDSHSMVEGAIRLLNFQADGFQAAWDEYRLRGCHSFLHYYWPALLYSVFGIHQSVVYWANGLFLLGILLAFWTMLPPINGCWKLVWIVGFLGIPVCFHIIHDFRSEVTMSALIFIGCVTAVRWSWEEERKRLHFWLTAGCFSLALAVKPVMFPYTFGMLFLCTVVYLASRLEEGRAAEDNQEMESHCVGFGLEGRGLLCLLKQVLPVVMLWLIVILPSSFHFIINRNAILSYIDLVAFRSDFYKQKPQVLSNLAFDWHDAAHVPVWAFHWLGWSGVWHLSVLRIFFAVMILLGVLSCLIPGLRGYAPDKKWVSLTFLTVGAFAGIAVNSVEQYYFGMTFQLLLAATAISWIALLFSRPLPRWVPFAFVALVGYLYFNPDLGRPVILPVFGVTVCMIMLALFLKLTETQRGAFVASGLFALLCWLTTQVSPDNDYVARTNGGAGPEGLAWRRGGARLVFELIEKSRKAGSKPTDSLLIWCSDYGWVDGRTIGWEAVTRGHRWMVLTMTELPKPPDWEYPPYADYFVLAEGGVMGTIKTPNSSGSAWDVAKLLKSNPDLELVGQVTDPKEKKITILKNKHPERFRDSANACPEWMTARILRVNQKPVSQTIVQ